MRKISFKEYLKDISENSNSEIEKFIAEEVVENESPYEFLHDVCQHWCVSGCFTGLIYYWETHKFFDDFYEEINELFGDFQESTWEALMIEWDLKNFLCWFTVEYRAKEIIDNYELI